MTEIGVGSYVGWPGGRGRVDLIVTKGSVPGVDGDADAPAARVVVWGLQDGGWAQTGRRVAVKTLELTAIPPPLPAATGTGWLVALLAAHQEYADAAGLPGHARPAGAAVKSVYARALGAWPGLVKTELMQQEWALERVQLFLAIAAERADPFLTDYEDDLDLLPEGHPYARPRP